MARIGCFSEREKANLWLLNTQKPLGRSALHCIISILLVFWVIAAKPQISLADHILSDADTKIMRSALKAAEKQHWKTVRLREKQLRDPLAKKFLRWRRLAADGVTPGFYETEKFRRENLDWPRSGRLLRRAEQAIPRSWSHKEVIAWFGAREPLSALGAARLGEAERATGLIDRGIRRIRDVWVTGDFNRSQSRAFYKQFRSILSRSDHQKRLDRLLWDGRHRSAQRLLSLVDKDWQKLAQARIALRQQYGNVDTLISHVPKALKSHPGLVYERLRWRRKKNLGSAIELAKSLGPELPYASKFWKERSVLARRALRQGNITDAYKIARKNGLSPGGADYAEAEWLSGWIALRFLEDYKAAFLHFERMHNAVKFPISIARGAYWAGRAREALGEKGAAYEWYKKAAVHPLTYYGQLAFARTKPGKGLNIPHITELLVNTSTKFDQHEIAKVVGILGLLQENDLVKLFLKSLIKASEDPEWWARTARLAMRIGRPDLSILVGKKAVRAQKPIPLETFPIVDLPKLSKKLTLKPPEVPLSLAVIRQESAFRVNAISPAGARGLMQLMPATAKIISNRLKMRYSRSQLTASPKYNLALGQSYLGELIDKFRGSYVLALVSYNAGPRRARRWIISHGDPRDKEVDAVDWVEMIPFIETRDYVQRVLENLQVYRKKLSNTDLVLGLESDLHF